MKKSLQIILTLFLLCIFSNDIVFSQIVIKSSDIRLPIGSDEGNIRAESVTLPIPIAGEDIEWDYRKSIGLGINYIINYNAYDNNPNFPGATAMYSYNPNLGSIEIKESKQYFTYNESGFYDSGFETQAEVYSISQFTGGPNDNITMLNSFNYFSNYKIIDFPLTFGKTWQSTKRGVTKFTLNIPAFFVINSPGELVQTMNSTYEVVGHGTLRVAAMDGVPALLLKTTTIEQDSVYLNGAPAPSSLLNAFEIVQGQKRTSYTYKFYVSDSVSAFSSPALSLYATPENDNINYFEYCDEEYKGFILSVEDDKKEFSLYPNPATNNEINVTFNKANNSNWTINLMNISGQIIEKADINVNGDINHKFDLNNLAKGVYLVVVYDENGKHKFSKEFIK